MSICEFIETAGKTLSIFINKANMRSQIRQKTPTVFRSDLEAQPSIIPATPREQIVIVGKRHHVRGPGADQRHFAAQQSLDDLGFGLGHVVVVTVTQTSVGSTAVSHQDTAIRQTRCVRGRGEIGGRFMGRIIRNLMKEGEPDRAISKFFK